MILLDGFTYRVHQTKYGHDQTKIASEERTLTGDLLRTEAGVFVNHYKMTLICTLADVANLRVSFAKAAISGTPPQNRLNFTDEEGFNWNPVTGVNDATHAFSTGVYFHTFSQPRPMTAVGWINQNRFLVDIELVAIAKGIAA